MANNVTIDEGTGKAIAADDVSSVWYQRIKITDGTEDSTTSLKVVAEDAAHTTGDTGLVAMAVRQDTAASLSGTDGDYNPLITDSTGKLHVNVGNTVTVASHAVTNAGTFVTQENGGALTSLQLIDDTVFAEDVGANAADKGIAILAVRRDADTTLVGTDNDYANLQVNANGALKVEAFSGETLPVSFTGSGDVATQTTLASLLTSSQLVDDIVYTDDTSTHATGTSKGALFMAAATPTDASVNANDIGAVAMTTDRKLHVAVMDALPAGTAAIGKLAANSGVDIGDVDVTTVGTITPGTAASSLGKAEDAVHGSGDVGVMVLAVRNDAGTTLAADGDYIPLSVDSAGAVRVTGGGGGTQYTEADVDASITGTAILWEDTSDTLRAVSSTKRLPVEAYSIGEVAHDAVDTGNPVKVGGHARSGTPSDVADNDRVDAWFNLKGAIGVHDAGLNLSIDDGGNSITVDNGGTFAVQGTAVGTIADDATTPGNPVMIGGKAVETDGTDPTSVSAEDDVAILRTDRQRLLLVNQTHPRHWHVSADYSGAQTNTSIKAAPGASLSLYITDISISNGAVAGNITLLDGSGGTVIYEIYPAINGGAVENRRNPIRLTANTALCITSTTVTTHSVNIGGYIAP